MPYLKPEDKKRLTRLTNKILNTKITSPGDLNYLITQLCLQYLKQTDGRYQHHNDVVGAIEGAKLEFYRRATAVYEDSKIESNGDVGYDEI